MILLHLVVLFRAEREYIKQILHISEGTKAISAQEDDDLDDNTTTNNAQADQIGNRQALRVAKKIQEEGIGESRLGIRGLTTEQRVVAMKAVFNKLLTGEDPVNPKNVGKEEKFKFKHGLAVSNLHDYKTHNPATKNMM